MIIKSLSDQVYEYIFRKIRIGDLKDGDKIEENSLIDELGISRTPIREALIQLTSDHLLENRPRKGYYVKLSNSKEISELWDIISVLDSHAIELAIVNDSIDNEKIEHLTNCLSEIDNAITCRDYESYYKWQEEFHMTYLSNCGNEVLEKEMKMLLKRTLRMTYYSQDKDILFDILKKSNAQHKQILEAIKNHDAKKAKSIVMEHWGCTLEE